MASNGRNRECPLPPVGEFYVFYSRDQGSGESFIVFVIQICLRWTKFSHVFVRYKSSYILYIWLHFPLIYSYPLFTENSHFRSCCADIFQCNRSDQKIIRGFIDSSPTTSWWKRWIRKFLRFFFLKKRTQCIECSKKQNKFTYYKFLRFFEWNINFNFKSWWLPHVKGLTTRPKNLSVGLSYVRRLKIILSETAVLTFIWKFSNSIFRWN